MRAKRVVTITTYTALVAAAGASLLLFPTGLSVKSVKADDPPDSIRLRGTIRDFRAGHPDFDQSPSAGYGHYAGNIALRLDGAMRPVFLSPSHVITDFDIVNDQVVSGEDFAVEVTVVGSAIENSDYDLPVTAKVHVGGRDFQPYGRYDSPVTGNLNDDQSVTGNANGGVNPRATVLSGVFNAGSPIAATGQSWEKTDDGLSGLDDDHWESYMVASTLTAGPQVRVLRDGDSVPNMAGAFDQASVAEYLEDYIDFSSSTVDIEDYQAIFLFEIGQAASEDGADFQDLVLLVSLASDPSFFLNGDVETGQTYSDNAGFRVDQQWRDRDSHPIAPHLFMNGSSPPLQLRQAPTLANHSVVDSFNPEFGPYSRTNAGPAPPLELGATMPALAAPTGLPYQDEIRYDGDNAVLSSNVHCSRLELDGHSTLQVNGHVVVIIDDRLEMENGSEITLGTNASLTVYCRGDVRLDNGAEINVENHDPSQVTINVMGAGDLLVHNHAMIYANIVAPDAILSLHNHAELCGRFTGRGMSLNNQAGFHLANDSPTNTCGAFLADTAGEGDTMSTGGITSGDTFRQWYADALGANLAGPHSIVLVNDGTGVYEFSDDEFYPIDGRMFGNDGDDHNYYFTFTLGTRFVYDGCGEQFFEFAGADDAWLFIGGRLVMDLGGVMPDSDQYVDLDRLGLVDGQSYPLQLFFAQRQSFSSEFRVRTNILLEGSGSVMASGGYD